MNIMMIALVGLVASAQAAQHQVVSGEHLWSLAQRYYGNPHRWRVIAGANGNIKDPHWIFPGQLLEIPDAASLPAAAPVEASAAIPEGLAPVEPVEASAPEPAAAFQEAPAAYARPLADELPPAPRDLAVPDSLSTEIPKSFAGKYPSMSRVAVPEGWKPSGLITGFDGREIMAGQGDRIDARLTEPAVIGEFYYILRQDAAHESDEDRKAAYYQRVGLVKVTADLGKFNYRFLILKSGDAVQLGDLLTKEGL